MDANLPGKSDATRTSPLMLGAAVSVIILSAVGIGAVTGVIPSAMSQKADGEKAAAADASGRRGTRNAQPGVCSNCGTVEAVRAVELRGDASGVGAVAGGVTGAVIGNQFGSGRGNTAMTILGAAGGALAGNEIERNMKKRYAYRVTVRMEDGSYRTLPQNAPPPFAVGDKVRIVDGALVHAAAGNGFAGNRN